METVDPDVDSASKAHPPPFIVSLSPFTPISSPSPRRLSSCFTEPNRPAVRAATQLAWVSLQGRLIGAEEASSARTLSRENGLALGPNEALAWELFSPVHRILIVAVIAVAAANSKSNRLILKLKKDVELRDQVLLHMQQKLDNLCEQVNCFKDQPIEAVTENYGCQLCQLHNVAGNSVYKISNCDEMSKQKWNGADQEERRMSDLSDWNSSVTSSSEIQLNSLAIEQDIYNLKKESEDKDATIKELSAFIQSSEAFGSKRIAELEDVIHRKNMMINKLKEDLLVLEQKVVGLTRIRRSSFSGTQKNDHKGPLMVDNLVYDMDSTTGPSSSSSDSDSSSPVKHSEAAIALTQDKDINKTSNSCSDKEKQSVHPKTTCVSLVKSRANNRVPVTSTPPLKEKILNQEVNVASTPRLLKLVNSFGNENCKSRGRPPTQSRSKRWV